MMNLKKLGALAVVSTLVLTGCGTKKVTCTATVEDSGKKYKAEIIGNLKNNKISSMSEKMIFEDESEAKEMCGMLGLVMSMSSDENEKIDYKCDGKSITINNFEKMMDSEDDKYIGLTKDEFISKIEKAAKDDNSEVTCK